MKKLFVVAYILFVLILSAKARAINLDSDPCFDKFHHQVDSNQTRKVQDPLREPSSVESNPMSTDSNKENFVG